MRYVIISSFGFALASCASVKTSQDVRDYKLGEMSVVIASHFDLSKGPVSAALKPSFDKFGAPQQYVTGKMSAVDRADLDRLYGSGEISKRFTPNQPVVWRIDGQALAGNLTPIAAVHLVYNAESLENAQFNQFSMDTRRGQTFTVFERRESEQIIVSLYPSPALPSEAVFDKISFE